MSFGAVAGAIAGPVIGGLLGGSQDAPSQTSTQTLDPEIRKYIYGDASNKGVLPSATDWFNQNSGGLNQQMIDGLNRQYSIYADPNTAQGYTNQQSLGQSLLNAPIAGNPFTSGQMSLGSNQVRQPTNPVQQPMMPQVAYQNPAQMQQAPSNPFIYSAPVPVAAPAPVQTAPTQQPALWTDRFTSDGQR